MYERFVSAAVAFPSSSCFSLKSGLSQNFWFQRELCFSMEFIMGVSTRDMPTRETGIWKAAVAMQKALSIVAFLRHTKHTKHTEHNALIVRRAEACVYHEMSSLFNFYMGVFWPGEVRASGGAAAAFMEPRWTR